MMPAAKHFDPVLGVDIHIIQPPGPVPPVPVPHPFVGMVIDPFDYVPVIGATVMVNGVPRGQAGTAGKCIPPHIPIGGVFVKPPANECEIFMGSKTVEVDGDAFSYLGLPVLSCHDVGMVPPPRPKKKSKVKSMVLPTSVVLPIPAGPPVLVGGPPTISLMAIGMRVGMAALGKLGKGLRRLQRGGGKFGRAMQKASRKAHNAADAAMKKLKVPPSVRNKVHRGICTVTGHPVDVATGKVFTEIVDFEIPGPIPLKWERVWYSTSTYTGDLGHGWHHPYDMALVPDQEADLVAVRLADGRTVMFPFPGEEQKHFDRTEKLTLYREGESFVLRDKERRLHHFAHEIEGVWPLSSLGDTVGNQIRFQRDAHGALRGITDSGGRYFRVETDRERRITTIHAPHPDVEGQTFPIVRYVYDELGNLVESRDGLNQARRFVYQGHLLVQETDRNGLSFYFEYDGEDEAAKCLHTWGDGGIYNHRMEYFDGMTVVENSLEHKTTYFHKGGGVVTQVINARGHATATEFNEFNEKVAEIDPLGNVTSYIYDERGNTIETVNPDGGTTNVVYDENDLPVEMLNAVGGKWLWKYDSRSCLIEKSTPTGEISRYDYVGPRLAEITNPGGYRTVIEHETAGGVSAVHSPNGGITRWQYDRLGRAVLVIDPKGNSQRRTLDLLGRIVHVDEPDGDHRFLRYDPEGNLIHVRDNNHDLSFTFSGMGKMTSRSEADITVELHYNSEEQLVGIKNEQGSLCRFDLDETGLIVVETGFDQLTRRYTRDPAGRVVRIDRPEERYTTFSYDPMGRITAVRYSDSTEEHYRFRVDGSLIEATNDATTIRLERDTMGRVIREWQGEHWIASEYGPHDARTCVLSSLGAFQQIERDAMGDVTKVLYSEALVEEGGLPQTWEAGFKRDPLGLEVERQLPGGIFCRWQRDPAGRPVQQEILSGQRTVHESSYRWSVGDRLKSISMGSGGRVDYEHDGLGNLVAAYYGDGTEEQRIPDAVGNFFKSKARDDRQFGPAGQLLQSHHANGMVKFLYDGDGNLTEKRLPNGKRWRFEWNDAGMMTKIIRPDGDEVRFDYDALGRRIRKYFRGRVTAWVWDGNNPLHEWVIAEGDDVLNGDIEQDLSKNSAFVVNPVLKTSTLASEINFGKIGKNNKTLITWIFYPETLLPLSKIEGKRSESVVTDQAGYPVLSFSNEGKILHSKIPRLWPDNNEAENIPFRYTGQYWDSESGLYYNRFRYFDPQIGGYLSQDPIRLWGGTRFYAYVHDPNVWIDGLGCAGTPSGFKSYGQYKQFSEATQAALSRAGYPNTQPLMQGSAVTGRSYSTGQPFDVGRTSDFDVALVNQDLFDKAESMGLTKGSRSMPLDGKTLAELEMLGLGEAREKLSGLAGRDVNFMIFKDEASARAKAPTAYMPCKK